MGIGRLPEEIVQLVLELQLPELAFQPDLREEVSARVRADARAALVAQAIGLPAVGVDSTTEAEPVQDIATGLCGKLFVGPVFVVSLCTILASP